MRSALARLASLDLPKVSPHDLPFPTAAQLDLAKAAILGADAAAPAWRRWKARGLALEAVDEASGRLFSQLWINHEAAGIGDDDLALLKGVYRQTLAHNAVTLAAGLEMSQPLAAAGIPMVFIKGAAMIAMAGGRIGLRRTNDVDVLIPEADAARAMAIMRGAGYQSTLQVDHTAIGAQHAVGFRGAAGVEIDLHWWAFKVAGDDRAVFETACPATLLGRGVLVPSPTECLVGAVGGAFSCGWSGSPLRWIADAMLLLENSTIDWDYVVQRAARPGLTLALADGLGFLVREFAAPIPSRVVAELRRRPVGWRERGNHWAVCDGRRPGRVLLYHLEQHRARRLRYPADVPWDLLGHLAQVTGKKSGRRRDVVQRLRAPAPVTQLR
ncbi:hypothetical protein FHT44_000576 [Mycolicibacterium sp. BK634]|uniref:nucleotidyltransferase family protein n=1 Tax=Mycolicibacterium sp. BK634 TaxID=2587099 RepID=UPI00161EFCE3|nr:nucleotidyltransferase family protein [Mycolicibacterium sp. BK634]MBB3748115.1 hypothetical protein [Mycolicibacterium sp. BK634]